jgi:hypothetical protein
MLATKSRSSMSLPVVRLEATIPHGICTELLVANGLVEPARLRPNGSTSDKILLCESWPTSSVSLTGWANWDKPPSVLFADDDSSDIFASEFMPRMERARTLLGPNAKTVPSAVEVHVALVQSDDLMRLNSASTAGGFDMSKLNVLSSRSHIVRLDSFSHKFLSHPTSALSHGQDDLLARPLANGEAHIDIEVRDAPKGERHFITQARTQIYTLAQSHASSTVPFLTL